MASEAHHLLSRQFRSFFQRVGLDVDQFVVPLEKSLHKKVHGKGGGQAYLESRNKQWEAWIKKNPNASRGDVLRQMNKMRKEFGI